MSHNSCIGCNQSNSRHLATELGCVDYIHVRGCGLMRTKYSAHQYSKHCGKNKVRLIRLLSEVPSMNSLVTAAR